MRNLLTIGFLSVLLLAGFFFLRSLKKELTVEQTAQPTRQVATAYQAKIRYFNQDNQLTYLSVSKEVQEFSNDKGTYLVAPEVSVFEHGNMTWQGQSQKAVLSADKNDLTLTDKVHIVESPNSEKPTFIDGEVMYYHAPTKEISSDQKVTIDDGSMRQTSNYLRLNTATRKMVVDQKVTANYATPEATSTNTPSIIRQ